METLNRSEHWQQIVILLMHKAGIKEANFTNEELAMLDKPHYMAGMMDEEGFHFKLMTAEESAAMDAEQAKQCERSIEVIGLTPPQGTQVQINLPAFTLEYKKAKLAGQESFHYNGHEFLTAYAGHMIEHMMGLAAVPPTETVH